LGPLIEIEAVTKHFCNCFFFEKGQVDKKGLIPIYLTIAINGETAEISTSRKVDLSKWDSVVE